MPSPPGLAANLECGSPWLLPLWYSHSFADASLIVSRFVNVPKRMGYIKVCDKSWTIKHCFFVFRVLLQLTAHSMTETKHIIPHCSDVWEVQDQVSDRSYLSQGLTS